MKTVINVVIIAEMSTATSTLYSPSDEFSDEFIDGSSDESSDGFSDEIVMGAVREGNSRVGGSGLHL
jgi:hypothetical protein